MELSDAFRIVQTFHTASLNFTKKVPRTEEEQEQQEIALQNDQNTVWYDPDSIDAINKFFRFGKWPEWFKRINKGDYDTCLHELWDWINLHIPTIKLYMLDTWENEFLKGRRLQGKPEFSYAYNKEQREKLASKAWVDYDSEAKAYLDYEAIKIAVQWVNDKRNPAPTDNREPEKIYWQGTESKLVILIDQLYEKEFLSKDKQPNRDVLLANHFTVKGNPVKSTQGTSQPEPIIWKGTGTQLHAVFLLLAEMEFLDKKQAGSKSEKGKRKGGKLASLLSKHFVYEGGEPIIAKSLTNSNYLNEKYLGNDPCQDYSEIKEGIQKALKE